MKIFCTILSGGKSKRLNSTPKGNIKIRRNSTTIKNIINQLTYLGLPYIAISSNAPQFYQHYHIDIFADNYLDAGPIAGILTTLEKFENEATHILYVPADLPNITIQEFYSLQVFANENPNSIVYACAHNNSAHPLFAIIPVNKLSDISQLFNYGECKIINIWQQLNAKPLYFENLLHFANINTIEDFARHSYATIWIISGAGRGVGKTTLAKQLTDILPNAVYAKCGHGKFKSDKTPNFFDNLNAIENFIDQNCQQKQHIIIEANSFSFAITGDVRIFIGAIPSKTHVRKDAALLKSNANIVIGNIVNESAWQKILNTLALEPEIHQAALEILKLCCNHI
jgi:molybdopterin-guanine dinucleotide biosynthesis protein A